MSDISAQKVVIKYGIGEGDFHGRAFVVALKEAGFEIVQDARKADIVVTHSGGCFFLPPLELRQSFIIINPVYWPGKSLVVSTIQKVVRDYLDYARDGRLPQWFLKTMFNLIHILRFILRSLTFTLHPKRRRFFEALSQDTTVIVRNDDDAFLSPDADRLLHENMSRRFRFYRLPGQHDTCWRDPEPYIDIIRRETRR